MLLVCLLIAVLPSTTAKTTSITMTVQLSLYRFSKENYTANMNMWLASQKLWAASIGLGDFDDFSFSALNLFWP